MRIINPKEIKPQEFHAYMLGAIAPRPIAFASTIDKDGNPNLAPFSFFINCTCKCDWPRSNRAQHVTVKHTCLNFFRIDGKHEWKNKKQM